MRSTRRRVKQTLKEYARAINLNGRSLNGREPGPDEAQAILNDFCSKATTARARDIPAMALQFLPIAPHQLIIVFDDQGTSARHDDADVVLVISDAGTKVCWLSASVTVGRGY